MKQWLARQNSLLFAYRCMQRVASLTPRLPSIFHHYFSFAKRYQDNFSNKFIFLLPSEAIGPSTQAIQLYFRHCHAHGLDPRRDTVIITRRSFCNAHLLKLLMRDVDVTIDDDIVDEIENGGDRYLLRHNKALVMHFRNGDTLNLQWKPSFSFDEEETEYGYSLLKRLGLSHNSQWVAVHNKDNFFYKELQGVDKEWDDYRSSSFATLEPTIQYLKTQGFAVIRSGHYADDPSLKESYLSLNPFTRDEQAFLGLFIQAKALFSINGLSGLANVAYLFDTPCLCHNAIPLGEPPVIERGIVLPKLIINKKGRILSLAELQDISTYILDRMGSKYVTKKVTADAFQATYLYKKYALQVSDNTEQEILESAKEMIHYVNNTLVLTEQERQAQHQFRSTLRLGHPLRHFGGIISPSFLSRYPNYASS